MINISIVNKSTLFADKDLPTLANAMQIQVTRDFLPSWGIDAKIYYTPSGQNPSPSHWVLALLDDADMAGALGYHDVTPTDQPLGKAFVRTTLADGGQITVTVSHELLEMLGDPTVSLCSQDSNVFWAYENCDAVEADNLGYEITIPAGWNGAGNKILVSDFVLKSWWDRTAQAPYDFMEHIKSPLALAPGGYISFLDLNNLQNGWQQKDADLASPADQLKARPHLGSRRSRRAIPKYKWIRSTYEPGTEAISAQKER
jgi:hypothetical protein